MIKKDDAIVGLEEAVQVVYKKLEEQILELMALRKENLELKETNCRLAKKYEKMNEVYRAIPGAADTKAQTVELVSDIMLSPISYLVQSSHKKLAIIAIKDLLSIVNASPETYKTMARIIEIAAECDTRESFLERCKVEICDEAKYAESLDSNLNLFNTKLERELCLLTKYTLSIANNWSSFS